MTNPELIKPELIEAIKVYHFEPGDILIVRCTGRVSADAAKWIQEAFQRAAPGVKVMVLGDGMEIGVLRGLPPGLEERFIKGTREPGDPEPRGILS